MAEAAKDGLISSFFSLEITGKMVGAFREVTNLGSENAVVEDKSRGPDGKYINYHAGPAPTVELQEWPGIEESDSDPTHVLKKRFDTGSLQTMARNVLADLQKELV